MGFLDTNFAKVLLGATPYMQQRMANEQADARSQQFLRLAEETGQIMPQGQAGPPAAYASPSGINPEFAMRAAAIPGFQGLGASLIGEVMTGNRAREARDWSAKNLTAAQEAELKQRGQEFESRMNQQQYEFNTGEARREKEWGGLSAAQVAQLDQNERHANRTYELDKLRSEAQIQEIAERRQRATAGAFPLPGSKDFDQQLIDLNDATEAVDAVRQLGSLWGKTPWGMDRDALAQAVPYKEKVIGYLAKMKNTGALNEADQARYEKLLREPNANPFNWSSTMQTTLAELERDMMKRVEFMQGRNPYLPQVAAPAGFEDKSKSRKPNYMSGGR